MAFLQQVQINASIDNIGFRYSTTFHRCSNTLLVCSPYSVNVSKLNNYGKWDVTGEWIPSKQKDLFPTIETSPLNIIGCYSIEAFDAFALLIKGNGSTCIAFLNIEGAFLNKCELKGLSNICDADYDQQRKEFYFIFKNGKINVLTLRISTENEKSMNTLKIKKSFNMYSRAKGGSPTNSASRLVQIVTQDVTASFLLLSEDGMISSWDSLTLERIWHIDPSFFIFIPNRIIADKFGSQFVVHCKSKDNEKLRLEYWSPPMELSTCTAGQFGRVSLPIKNDILGLHIETINEEVGTLITVFSNNRNVQLWKANPGRLHHECTLILSGTCGHFGVLPIIVPDIDAEIDSVQEPREELELCDTIPEQSTLCGDSIDPRQKYIIPYKSYFPCVSHFATSSLLPKSCPLEIFSFIGTDFCHLAIHFKSTIEMTRFRKLNAYTSLASDMALDSVSGSDFSLPFPIAPIYNAISSEVTNLSNRHNNQDITNNNIDSFNEDDSPNPLESSKEISLTLPHLLPYLQNISFEIPTDPSVYMRSPSPSLYKKLMMHDHTLILMNPEIKGLFPLPALGNISLLRNQTNKMDNRNGVLSIMTNPSLLMIQSTANEDNNNLLNDITSNINSDSQYVIGRNGLDLVVAGDSQPRSEMLRFELSTIAPRLSLLVGISELNEGFIFDLKKNPSVNLIQSRPLRFSLDLASQTIVTSLAAADVELEFPAPRNGPMKRMLGKGSSQVGTHCLIFAGDANGRISFILTSSDSIIQMGSFLAHSHAIDAISFTGCAARPLWKLQGEWVTSDDHQILPTTTAGSGILTLSRDGELKMWHPVFSPVTNAKSTKEMALSVHTITWKITGTFCSSRIGSSMMVKDLDFPLTVALDPTCLTVFISFGEGMIHQWPLPGLIDNAISGEVLAVCKSAVWINSYHKAPITAMRTWVALSDHSVVKCDAIQPDINKLSRRGQDQGQGWDAVSGLMTRPFIGYKLDTLRILALTATMVTSSVDGSIILWRFMISADNVSHLAPMVSKMRYLHPTPCRKVNFSSAPSIGICYSSKLFPMESISASSNENSIQWTLAVALGGVVITVLEGTRSSLMLARNIDDNFDGKENSRGNTNNSLFGGESDSVSVPINLSGDTSRSGSNITPSTLALSEEFGTLMLLPVLCTVKWPTKLSDTVLKKIPGDTTSRMLLNDWKEKSTVKDTIAPAAPILQIEDVTGDVIATPSTRKGIIETSKPPLSTVAPYVPKVVIEKILEVGNMNLLEEEKKLLKLANPNKDNFKPRKGFKKVLLNGIRMNMPVSSKDYSNGNNDKDDATSETLTVSSITPEDDEESYYSFEEDELEEDNDEFKNNDKDNQDDLDMSGGDDLYISESSFSIIKTGISGELDNKSLGSSSSRGKDGSKKIYSKVIVVPRSTSGALLEERDSLGLVVPVGMASSSSKLGEKGKELEVQRSKDGFELDHSQNGNYNIPVTNFYDIDDVDEIDMHAPTIDFGIPPDSSAYLSPSQRDVTELLMEEDRMVMMSAKGQKITPSLSVKSRRSSAKESNTFIPGSADGKNSTDSPLNDYIPSKGSDKERDGDREGAHEQSNQIVNSNNNNNSRRPQGKAARKVSKPAQPTVYLSKTGPKQSLGVKRQFQPYRGSSQFTPPPDADDIAYEMKYQRTVLQKPKGGAKVASASNPTRTLLGIVIKDDEQLQENTTGIAPIMISRHISVQTTSDFGPQPVSFFNRNAKPMYASDTNGYGTEGDVDSMLSDEMGNIAEDFLMNLGVLDRVVYNKLDEEGKEMFMDRRKEEFKSKVEESRQVFKELVGVPRANSVDIIRNKVTLKLDGVMKWVKVQTSLSEHEVSLKEIKSLFADSTGSKGKHAPNKAASMGNFTRFAFKLERKIMDKFEPPEVTWRVESLFFDMIVVTVLSSRAGTVFAVAAEEGRHIPYASDFDNINSLKQKPGIIAVETGKTAEDFSEVELVFSGLTADTPYCIFVCAEHPSGKLGKPSRMNDEMIMDTLHIIRTTKLPLESLDIEWSRLDENMREVEVSAAIRDVNVQAQAKVDNITFPSDEDLTNRKFKGSAAARRWKDFVTWWTDGDENNGFSVVRRDFLLREVLFSLRHYDYLDKCYMEGYLTEEEKETIESRLYSEDDELQLICCDEFVTFRSWYKGGRVMAARDEQDREEGKQRTINRSLSGISVLSNDRSESSRSHSTRVKSRLHARTAFLEDRVMVIEGSKSMVNLLIEKHQKVEKKGLTYNDVKVRRSKMTPEDIDAVLSSKKLLDICTKLDLDITKVQTIPLQLLAGTSMFTADDLKDIEPDEPPPIVLMCLPGTNRRPVKPWHLCGPVEQGLELRLACMFDDIVELAIADDIVIPDVEDANLDRHVFPGRAAIWDKFTTWYAGDEETNAMVGFGVPTLARVVFSDWEKKEVACDSSVADDISVISFGSKSIESRSRGSLAREPAPLKKQNSLLISSYDKAVNSGNDGKLREKFLHRRVKLLLQSRHLCVLKLLWPPGPAKIGHNYMFPRLGVITPKYEFPPKKLRLYMSRSRETYTLREILNWYSSDVLAEDDNKLIEAEQEGVRIQAYEDWLAAEDKRREEGRENMQEEDLRSYYHRDYLEDSLRRTSMLDLENAANQSGFGVFPFSDFNLLFGLRTFPFGCGVDNDDEMEELQEEVARKVQEVMNAARAKKRKAIEDRRRLEEAERLRQEREERDRRLEEGVARRRVLRMHLNSLKAERKKLAEDELLAQQEELLRQEELRLQEANEQVRQAYEQHLEQERQRELREMRQEEFDQMETERRRYELKRMEHEDIISYIRGLDEIRNAEMCVYKIEELAEIYTPFHRYRFNQRRVSVPTTSTAIDTDTNTKNKDDSSSSAPFVSKNRLRKLTDKASLDRYLEKFMLFREDEEDAVQNAKLNEDDGFDEIFGDDELSASSCVHWKGPRKEIRSKFEKLRKRPRLYTNINASTDLLFRAVDLNLPVTSAPRANTLKSLGIPRHIANKAGDKKKKLTKSESVPSSIFQDKDSNLPVNKPPSPNATPSKNPVNKTKSKNASVESITEKNSKVHALISNSPLPAAAVLAPLSPRSINISKKEMHVKLDPLLPNTSKSSNIQVDNLQKSDFDVNLSLEDSLVSRRMKGLELQLNRKKAEQIQAASESVTKIQNERDSLHAYVEGDALFHDDFYLAACLPGIRPKASLESSDTVKEYLEAIHNRVANKLTLDLSPLSSARNTYSHSSRRRKSPKREARSQLVLRSPSSLIGVTMPRSPRTQNSRVSSPPLLETQISVDKIVLLNEITESLTSTNMNTPDLSIYSRTDAAIIQPGTGHDIIDKDAEEVVALDNKDKSKSKKPISIPIEPEWKGPQPDLRQVKYLAPFYRKTFGVVGANKIAKEPNPMKIGAFVTADKAETFDDNEKEPELYKSTRVAKHRAELSAMRRKNTITVQE